MPDIVRVDLTHRDGKITTFFTGDMHTPGVFPVSRLYTDSILYVRRENNDKTPPQDPTIWNEYEVRWTDKEKAE